MNQNEEGYKKFIGGWLRTVSNKVSHSFSMKLETSGVTVAEWVVLRMLYECGPSISPSEIARLTGLTRGAVSKLVDRATGKGFVIRTESKNDRRYQDIKLTAAAKKVVPKLTKLAQQNDDEFFSCLSPSERKTLVRLLKKVAEGSQVPEVPTD